MQLTCSHLLQCNSMYICSNCGYGSSSWLGKCPNCSEWNTFTQQGTLGGEPGVEFATKPLSQYKKQTLIRKKTGIHELDRVLGGGFVPGGVLLLSGEPGIGKSTLILQGLRRFKTLYVSGEEDGTQIKERADRLGIDTADFTFSNTVMVESLVEGIRNRKDDFEIVVIDSIQTLYSKQVDSQPGSVAQIREITYRLVQISKELQIPMIIVGHVTKGGDVAGPKTLEHIVDAVLVFEGERISQYRILRNQKNRFASTDEIGLFTMTKDGLEEVNETVAIIENRDAHVPGKSVSGVSEGSRPLFFEMQTLVVPTGLPMPRRVVKGIDYNKLLLLLAVLKKHVSLNFDTYDIYVNVVGGLDIKSPSADLGIIASLISSLKNVTLSNSTVFVGEVGLLGEIRHASAQKRIISEANRMGFKDVVTSKEVANVRDLYKRLIAK